MFHRKHCDIERIVSNPCCEGISCTFYIAPSLMYERLQVYVCESVVRLFYNNTNVTSHCFLKVDWRDIEHTQLRLTDQLFLFWSLHIF